MTDSNTSAIRRYVKPTEGGNYLTKDELRDLLCVDLVSNTVYGLYKKGTAIICATQTSARAGWLRADDQSSMDWLESRNYVEVFAAPEEILV